MQLNAHHTEAARRWIAANGMPTTAAEAARMGREVVVEANRIVQQLGSEALQLLAAFQSDRDAGTETESGEQGRRLLVALYQQLQDPNKIELN